MTYDPDRDEAWNGERIKPVTNLGPVPELTDEMIREAMEEGLRAGEAYGKRTAAMEIIPLELRLAIVR